ncbi:MAG: DegT/DnrJ/EryC1/StrS family aminotransferase [Candidatus Magasanikbacteria bacterium]|nr:DegT/DnrJ/EryC1/StrS family aminotransferase [Candidatus Magasanikbacteria bacterium]
MPEIKIPWWLPQVGTPEERSYLNQALDNNFVNEGPLSTKLETEIATLVGARYAVATTSCTTAIFLALKALGIGADDEVIVPDLTFIATANAVHLTGARPVLVDVEPATLNISLAAMQQAVTDRTKAIVPVHVTGRGAALTKILDFAAKHNLPVIEDAAEALFSKQGDKYLGTFGRAGCFSFAPNKTITTGQGGLIVTDDPELHIALRRLKDHGRPRRGTGGDDRHDTIGYNFKFTDLQAAVGLGQLTYWKQRIARMKKNYELYRAELAGLPGITVFPSQPEEIPQWTDIMVENRRDELETALARQGIDCRKYWFPLHQQLAYRLPDDNFPIANRLSPRCLWLPSAFTLTDADVHQVCVAIKKFFQA